MQNKEKSYNNIGMFCVDAPCIEVAWSGDVIEEKGGLLGMLIKQVILLVAPVINVAKVNSNRSILYVLPLNVAGTSDRRVVFEEEVKVGE